MCWRWFLSVDEGRMPMNFAVGWSCGSFFYYIRCYKWKFHTRRRTA